MSNISWKTLVYTFMKLNKLQVGKFLKRSTFRYIIEKMLNAKDE